MSDSAIAELKRSLQERYENEKRLRSLIENAPTEKKRIFYEQQLDTTQRLIYGRATEFARKYFELSKTLADDYDKMQSLNTALQYAKVAQDANSRRTRNDVASKSELGAIVQKLESQIAFAQRSSIEEQRQKIGTMPADRLRILLINNQVITKLRTSALRRVAIYTCDPQICYSYALCIPGKPEAIKYLSIAAKGGILPARRLLFRTLTRLNPFARNYEQAVVHLRKAQEDAAKASRDYNEALKNHQIVYANPKATREEREDADARLKGAKDKKQEQDANLSLWNRRWASWNRGVGHLTIAARSGDRLAQGMCTDLYQKAVSNRSTDMFTPRQLGRLRRSAMLSPEPGATRQQLGRSQTVILSQRQTLTSAPNPPRFYSDDSEELGLD